MGTTTLRNTLLCGRSKAARPNAKHPLEQMKGAGKRSSVLPSPLRTLVKMKIVSLVGVPVGSISSGQPIPNKQEGEQGNSSLDGCQHLDPV